MQEVQLHLVCMQHALINQSIRYYIFEVYFFTYISGPPVSKQPVLTQSDSEEEIDFGFWEKAPVPSNGIPNSVLPNHDNARTENGLDKDLSLL